MLRILIVVVGLYVLYAAASFALQRLMLFPGQGRSASGRVARHVQAVWLSLPEGPVEAWFMPAAGSGRRPAILFAHGNGELIEDRAGSLSFLNDAGVSVLLVEYPGYGRSQGSPSQQSIALAMDAGFSFLFEHPEVDEGRIALYGHSLGGAAVCTLLERRRPAAVALQSTFVSVEAFARARLLPGVLVRDPFDNRAALARYDGPVLLMHGRRDPVIPFWHGEALSRVLRRGRFVELPCGHNDCAPDDPHVRTPLLAFLREHGLASW
jgi:pimeloyl-ACP methyl ester carboxylesterase